MKQNTTKPRRNRAVPFASTTAWVAAEAAFRRDFP